MLPLNSFEIHYLKLIIMKMFNCNKIQKGAMKSCNKILKNLGNSKLYTVYMINKFKYRISLVSKLSLIYIR